MSTKSKPKYLLVLFIGMLATVGAVLTSGILTTQTQVAFSGTITPSPSISVVVYDDAACTIPASPFSLGALHPGDSTSKTYYLKNTGNSPVTITGAASSWSPAAAANYMTVTWNREGATIPAGQSISAIITLNVSSGITGISTYSFNYVINGTG